MSNPMIEALADDDLIQEAFDRVFERGTEMTVEQFATYLRCVSTIAIAGMRGHQGDDFTKGFLEAALKDLEAPSLAYTTPKGPSHIH